MTFPSTVDSRTDALLAEDLMLMLFQPESGTIAGENTLFYVLGGAILAELAHTGAVSITDEGLLRGPIITAVGTEPPTDELLSLAWQYVTGKPRGIQTVLAAIGPGLRAPLLERLILRGEVRRERRRILGLIPSSTLVDGDTGRRDILMGAMRAVLVDGVPPDTRTASLTALVYASGTLSWFSREIPWTSAVIDRAEQLKAGDWGADAAAQAVARTMLAITTSTVATAAALANR